MENTINSFDAVKDFILQNLFKQIDGITISPENVYKSSQTVFKGIRNGAFSIESSIPFNVFTTHLPHTRIYVVSLENEYFNFTLLEYFNFNLLLIEKAVQNDQNSVRVNITSPYRIIKQLRIDEKNIYINSPYNSLNETNILHYLRDIYIRELKIHPFSYLKSKDKRIVNEIENLWIDISGISSKGELIHEKYLFWLQEIFLHRYNIKIIENFYKEIPHNELEKKSYLKKCFIRYKMVSGQYAENFKVEAESGILKEYIMPQLREEELLQLIQSEWRKIAYPAKELFFSDELNKAPDKYIALLFLSLKYNFYWSVYLYEKIRLYLNDKELRTIVSLLYILKKHGNLYPEADLFYAAPQSDSFVYNKIKTDWNNTEFSVCRRYGKIVCELNVKDDNLHFKIDQKVQIIFNRKKTNIVIRPVIFRPPLEILEYNTIRIAINDTTLDVPLLWRQFSVHLNQCRIKFLLKKRRWQISFKINDVIKRILINNENISFNNNRYFSFDHDIKYSASKSNLQAFDKFGIAQQSFSKINDDLFLRGVGLRSNGLLIERFNIFKSNSDRSVVAETNVVTGGKLRKTIPPAEFSVSSAKFNIQKFSLKNVSGIVKAIRKTPAQELKNKLIVITDSEADIIKLINDIFYERMRFYPQISSIEKLQIHKNRFYIIISDAQKEELFNCTDFSVSPLFKSKISALKISKKNLKDSLSCFFTCI